MSASQHSTLGCRPSKTCGPDLTVTRDMEMTNQKRSIAQSMKIPKLFSNDPTKSCKTFCCSCDQVITLSGLRKHVKSRHQMTLTKYKELYGNHRKQIIQLVYHKCAFCQQSVLLDTDDLSKHLKKSHQVSYKEYVVRYMTNRQNIVRTTNLRDINEKKVDPVKERKENPLVVIRCDECPKTFKQNIQLKVHKRKHSARIA